MKVLAGDIGGTNTRLAVCEVEEGRVQRLEEETYSSAAHDSLEDIVRGFASKHNVDVRAACIGLPGPVRGRRAELTNLPWTVDADLLERALGLPHIVLINDLAANAHGLSTLDDSDFAVVRAGTEDPHGNCGLVSAGTGLGQAGIHTIKGRRFPFPTEGGHCDFAPANEEQWRLLQFLRRKYGTHISYERIVSGPGLANVYEFFRTEANAPEPAWLTDGDPADDITREALAGNDQQCVRALALFMGVYGSQAGNFALSVFATGGVYLGGGIAPKLAAAIRTSDFVQRFDDKGRMRKVVEHIPIRIVLNDKAALQGAALHAARYSRPGRD